MRSRRGAVQLQARREDGEGEDFVRCHRKERRLRLPIDSGGDGGSFDSILAAIHPVVQNHLVEVRSREDGESGIGIGIPRVTQVCQISVVAVGGIVCGSSGG